MMMIINKNFVLCFAFLVSLSYGSVANAQKYLGDLPRDGSGAAQEDPRAKPVPRIFSSDMVSTASGEKLDVVYNNLLASLWNYSVTDFRYQNKLMLLMKNERFKTTRYSKEFSRDLDDALANLNANYKSMLDDITFAEERYKTVREEIRSIDYEILDPLWREKINAFKERSKTYFKMQHSFLKTYRTLVAFILKQGGSYYYKEETNRVYFYRFEGYEFFAKSLDKLNRISFEQRKFLKQEPPANFDIDQ